MNELRTFHHDAFGDVRIINKNGEPWFVASDVCRAIGIGNTSVAIKRIDLAEKGQETICTNGGNQFINVVNKNGLMALILGSRKLSANAFKAWIKTVVFAELGLTWTLDANAHPTVSTTDTLQVFNSADFGSVRITEKDGLPWFVAKDVCRILEIVNTSQAMDRIDADDKTVCAIYTANNILSAWCVSEAGLYSLVLQSAKPEARQFKRWITHDVIPSIRKHGAYMTPETIERTILNPDFIIGLATRLKDEQEALADAQKQIAMMKPKADFYDDVADIADSLCMREAAKVLGRKGIGQNKLFKVLRDKGIFMENNEPYQAHVNAGHFKVIEKTWTDTYGDKHIYKVPVVTQRGLQYLARIV